MLVHIVKLKGGKVMLRRMDKGQGRLMKKRIKMKGLHMPQLFIFILGMFHNRIGLVTKEGERYVSPYIIKKEKDFHEYVAKLYKCTSKLLSKQVLLREQLLGELWLAKDKLETYPVDVKADSELPVKELRRINANERERNGLEKKIKECIYKLNEAEELIKASEAETSEMVLICRRKMEGLLTTYLSGARKVVQIKDLDITVDQSAIDIYRTHVYEDTGRILEEIISGDMD